jgi:aryl-alcohol dehydrogenase-like predicted oxidoreductase
LNYRTLGRTGLSVSEVGFGGAPAGIRNYLEPWDAGSSEAASSVVAALNRALDRGINYLDTAPGYGDGVGESIFGEVVARRRGECILATKTGARDPHTIRESLEASLRRLRTDCVDLLQFHGGWYPDDEVARILDGGALEEMLRLKRDGKTRLIGLTAEGPSGGVSRLIATGQFDVLQVRYNLMYQHTCDHVNPGQGVMWEAERQGMGIVTMRTLTSGAFQKLVHRTFPAAAGAVDLDAVLLGYVLSNPLVDVALVGMRRPEEVDRNVAASANPAFRVDLAELHHRFVSATDG